MEHKIGDLMAHATNDINVVRMAFGPGLVMATDAIFMTTAILIILLRTSDPRLTALALAPLPFLALTVPYLGRLINRRFRRVPQACSDLSARGQGHVAGIGVVKARCREESESRRFGGVNQRTGDRNMRLVRVWGMFHPLVQVLRALSVVIVVRYGGSLVIYG